MNLMGSKSRLPTFLNLESAQVSTTQKKFPGAACVTCERANAKEPGPGTRGRELEP